MRQPSLVLTNFCILDSDAQSGKFSFKLQTYSVVKDKRISRTFYFGGHTWKLQVTKKGGHFGMFLRWCGTEKEKKSNVNSTCTTTLKFSVINKFDPENSISEGRHVEKDTFDKLGGGIGYSKIITLHDVENVSGFLINDIIYLQLRIKVHATTYQDLVPISLNNGERYVEGNCFHFYGAIWKLLFYPAGDDDDEEEKAKETKDDVNDDEEHEKEEKEGQIQEGHGKVENNRAENETYQVKDKDRIFTTDTENGNDNNEIRRNSKKTSVYLQRHPDSAFKETLRHNVHFMISVDGKYQFVLEQHFHSNGSNVFGSRSFIPVHELNDFCQENEKLSVSVTFLHIVPYCFFAYKILNGSEVDFDTGFKFTDHQRIPWYFRLHKVVAGDDEPIHGTITLRQDTDEELKPQVKLSGRRKLEICWMADILSPVDIEKSVTFNPRGKRPLRDSLFGKESVTDVVEFPVSMEKLCEDNSPFLDLHGKICIRVSVLCCNSVAEIGQDELNRIYQELCRYRDTKQRKILELSLEEETDNEENKKEKEMDDRDILIQSLHDHIDSYETYIKDLEGNSSQVKEIYNMRSVSRLAESAKASTDDYKHLSMLAEHLEGVIKTLPLSISKFIRAGTFGQETVVAGHLQLDLILQLEDYNKQKHRLENILEIIRERIKEHSSNNPSDVCVDRLKVDTMLPYAYRFYRTHKALLFKLGTVNATILISRPNEIFKSYEALYEQAANVDKRVMYKYIALTAERQTEFIREQPELCKDLICITKTWSDGIKWESADYRPSSYLLALLLVNAYQTIARRPMSKTPSFKKEVLVEFGKNVTNTKLTVEWSDYYNPLDYPLGENAMFDKPLIRDPALPYHNVCQLGIVDWRQFRDEMEKWIPTLVF